MIAMIDSPFNALAKYFTKTLKLAVQVNRLISISCKQRRSQDPRKHLDQDWVLTMPLRNIRLKWVKLKYQRRV